MFTSKVLAWLLLNILSEFISAMESKFCPRYCKCNSFMPGRDPGLFNDPALLDLMNGGQISIVTYFHGATARTASSRTNREMRHIVCWGMPSLQYLGLPADISSFVIRGNINGLYPSSTEVPSLYPNSNSNIQTQKSSPFHAPPSINMNISPDIYKPQTTSFAPPLFDHAAILNDKDFPQANTVKKLELRNLNLTIIRPNMFQHLTNLQTLSLTDSKIEVLTARSFSGLWNLKELQLSNNSIQLLPDSVFLYVANLRRLHLNGNKLIYINELHFSALAHLLELDLSNNQITRISSASFAKLYHIQVLNLDNNKIETVQFHWFQHMNHLRKITLKGNQFAKIGDQQFQHVPHLNTLDVSNNHIQSINHIPKPQSLQSLSLAHNNITELNKNSFIDNSNLESLRLDHNQIQRIESQTFTGMVKLTDLSLAHNHLVSLDNGALQPLKKLKKLQISHNKINSLPSRVFYGLTELQEIHLDNNAIHVLNEETFSVAYMSQSSKLTWIFLQHNRIKCIKAYTFYGLPNMKVLNISHNNLQTVEDKGFVWMANLQSLNLDYNQLTLEERRPFYKNKNLSALNLAHNQIKQLHTNVFVGLDNLNDLDLSNNEILIIPKNILPNSNKLQRLSIQNNQIEEFRLDSISNPSDLKYLNLSNNKIASIHMTSKIESKIEILAIENNKLQTLPWYLEKHLASGVKISMKNNPWKCDCYLNWLTKTVQDNKTDVVDKSESICNTPQHLQGKQLFNISNGELTCHGVVDGTKQTDRQALSEENCDQSYDFLAADRTKENIRSVKKMLLQWHATIYDLDEVPVCSGVLLSEKWLLTTDFCWKLVMTSSDVKRFQIQVGDSKRFKIDAQNEADMTSTATVEDPNLNLLKIKPSELHLPLDNEEILYPDALCTNKLPKLFKSKISGTVGAHTVNSGHQVQSVPVRLQSKCRIHSPKHACVVTLNRNILSNSRLFILSGAPVFIMVPGVGWKLLGISEKDVWDRNRINTILITDYLRKKKSFIQESIL